MEREHMRVPFREVVRRLVSGLRVPFREAGAALVMLLLLAACDGGSPQPTPTIVATPTGQGGELVIPDAATVTPVPSPVGLAEDDRVTIYALVIGEILRPDLGTRSIFISPYIGQGEFLDNPDPNTPVPPTLMESLETAFHDRAFEVRDFEDSIRPLEEGGRVKNDGIFITLGPIVNTESDTVSVRASFYRGVGDARGDIFRFERDPSTPQGWELTEVKEEWNYRTTQGTPEP
jgi:hypothetical protein